MPSPEQLKVDGLTMIVELSTPQLSLMLCITSLAVMAALPLPSVCTVAFLLIITGGVASVVQGVPPVPSHTTVTVAVAVARLPWVSLALMVTVWVLLPPPDALL